VPSPTSAYRPPRRGKRVLMPTKKRTLARKTCAGRALRSPCQPQVPTVPRACHPSPSTSMRKQMRGSVTSGIPMFLGVVVRGGDQINAGSRSHHAERVKSLRAWGWPREFGLALPISHGSGDAASVRLGFNWALALFVRDRLQTPWRLVALIGVHVRGWRARVRFHSRGRIPGAHGGSKRASKRSGPANREPPPRIIRPPAKWRPATEGSNK
jgi:hypothetical protein